MAYTISLLYLIASVCFILALKGLSSPRSALQGNRLGMVGMGLAVLATCLLPNIATLKLPFVAITIGAAIGIVVAKRIKMTAMPQLVAAFHSLVGLAAVLVAAAALDTPKAYGIATTGHIQLGSLVEMGLGVMIGAITFSGSVIAFLKLQGIMSGKPILLPFQQMIKLLLAIITLVVFIFFLKQPTMQLFWCVSALSALLGVLLIIPIGGADMPVVVSMLNSYSGWAAAGIGFTLNNHLLIITGALVGASGAILSYIMCKAMNRSILNVIFGGFGVHAVKDVATHMDDDRTVNSGAAEDAAFMMSNASSVIIVPGYGMAVAQAQHALREMADVLAAQGKTVRYAIHPVAGRMPGHMNVLLAEANVPYDDVIELEEINSDFKSTDVTYVIGANDVTNPAAKNDPQSPIYGMPVLDVASAGTVLFVKRSMSPGYAGVENELFYRDNTIMLFGDAKLMTESIVKALKTL